MQAAVEPWAMLAQYGAPALLAVLLLLRGFDVIAKLAEAHRESAAELASAQRESAETLGAATSALTVAVESFRTEMRASLAELRRMRREER